MTQLYVTLCYVAGRFVLLQSVLIYMFIAMETATEKVLLWLSATLVLQNFSELCTEIPLWTENSS